MAYPQVPGFEALQTTIHEVSRQSRDVLCFRRWLKSVALSGLMGLAACATANSSVEVGSKGSVVKPVESGQEQKIEKRKPKPKDNTNRNFEPEKNGGNPPINLDDPDDCMGIDLDQPGACEMV
jgi:hypothetical protein